MSLFRFVKYSSILFFLGKHRDKLLRSCGVLLFALVSSLLYEDVRIYLAQQHPGTLIYALLTKVLIVYGSLLFVLLQFRTGAGSSAKGEARAAAAASSKDRQHGDKPTDGDRLDALSDLNHHDKLRSRYDRVLAGEPSDQLRKPSSTKRSSTKSSRS